MYAKKKKMVWDKDELMEAPEGFLFGNVPGCCTVRMLFQVHQYAVLVYLEEGDVKVVASPLKFS